jgi:riboflavin kinase / FMN adenylyltransferase
MDLTWLPDAQPRPRHVAVGEFDGVHIGHREVIRGADTVLTFEPHPRTVVSPEGGPRLLTSLEAKADLVARLGVRELVVVPFDGSFAAQSPEAFVEHVLVERLQARRVSVGANFRFGHRARGDAALLAAQDAFETRVAPLVELDGEVVSSSRIRRLVDEGAVDVAARYLGDPFGMRGIVAHGDKRGRTLGYPTANLVPDPRLVVPARGVYACRAHVPGLGRWAAAVSVGVRPMFKSGLGLLVEAYLLDFAGNLYGRELRLEFLRRLRGEQRFDSVEALIEQMGRDTEETARLAG